MEELIFRENEDLHITKYTQIAMLTVELAILRVLEEKGVTSFVNAGLSLGEYAALTASGGLSIRDALELVVKRGEFMPTISWQVCSFLIIPAICPAITVPCFTSPSITALRREPTVKSSSSSKGTPSCSFCMYSLVIWLRAVQTQLSQKGQNPADTSEQPPP